MSAKRTIVLVLTVGLVILAGLAIFGCGKAQSRPEITSLTPNNGSAGTQVVIVGAGFGNVQGTGTVHFGDSLAEVVAWTGNSVTVKVPAGLAIADYGVTVQTDAGASKEAVFTVNEAPKPGTGPVISSLKPTSGQPGTEVVISGLNFGTAQGSGTVLFGPGKAQVVAWSATSITFKVPQDAANNVYGVKVETSQGKSEQATFKVARSEDLAAQKAAIVSYMGSHGMETQGSDQWSVALLKQSAEDPNWEVLQVVKPGGDSFQALLINNQMLGDWECLSTEGPPWNGVDFKGAQVPSDLKNV
jgi:IPT/TIG domain